MIRVGALFHVARQPRRHEQVLHASPHDGGVLAAAVGVHENLRDVRHIIQEKTCENSKVLHTRARLNAGSEAAMTRWAYLAAVVRTGLRLYN